MPDLRAYSSTGVQGPLVSDPGFYDWITNSSGLIDQETVKTPQQALQILGVRDAATGQQYQPASRSGWSDYPEVRDSFTGGDVPGLEGWGYVPLENYRAGVSAADARQTPIWKAPLMMAGLIGGSSLLSSLGIGAGAGAGLDMSMLGAGEAGMGATGLDMSMLGAGEAGMSSAASGAIGPATTFSGTAASTGFSWEDLLKRMVSPMMPKGDSGGGFNVRNAADILSGIYGLTQSGKIGDLAAPGQDAAARLQQLTMDPSRITQLPGYQELLKQREVALGRRLAAQGKNLSGEEKASLAELGGAQYAEFYGQEMDRLARMTNSAYQPAVGEQQMRANAINRLIYGTSRAFGG